MEKIKAYFKRPGSKIIKNLLIVMVAFVVLDGLLTEYLIASGSAREANAFLAPLIGGLGFMLLKIVGSLVCALVLWDIYTRNQKLATISAWIAVVGYGLIVVWNTGLCFLT
jgi:hypothetical protein